MGKIDELIDAARGLSSQERRRLIEALDTLEPVGAGETGDSADPLAALRALSARVHSDFTDISTDKYAHVAAAARDSEG
jgi:hypothetical protein